MGIYREISVFRIRYYSSALVYTYSASISGTFSDISWSDSLKAVPGTGIWMQKIDGGNAVGREAVRQVGWSGQDKGTSGCGLRHSQTAHVDHITHLVASH